MDEVEERITSILTCFFLVNSPFGLRKCCKCRRKCDYLQFM